jgi:hypothetical protein
MYQKVLDQITTTYTIAGSTVEGASAMVLNSPWFLQPQQGVLQKQANMATQAIVALNPFISWEIQCDTDQAHLGLLQAQITTTTQGLQGEAARLSVTDDFTGEMLENDGFLRMDPDQAALIQYELTINNWSASAVTVQVKQTIYGSWLPQPAPAETADALGFGRGGVVPYPIVGSPVATVAPGHRQAPAKVDGSKGLPADFPEDPCGVV